MLTPQEDNGLSIADRTISLQYRQFRTPRKELKQLIYDNKKTYLLSDAEIQKYEKYLDRNYHLNGNLDTKKEQLKLSEQIYVDIEGFSIEIAKKLGNNYLRNNFILVSTKQIECDSLRDSYFGKYDKQQQNAVIRKIFNTHRNIIEQILTGEALIGTVNQKDLGLMVDNPESLFNIEITFDTPNNAISKLKNIRKDERKLLENKGKLKDRAFLKNLLQNIEDVSAEHGSLDRIPDKEINLTEKLDFNKLHLNAINMNNSNTVIGAAEHCDPMLSDNSNMLSKMPSIDIYCLRSIDGTIIFVYFFADSTLLYRQLKLHNDEKENYNKDKPIILNGKDIASLNVLMDLGMVGYNPYLGLERAANMIIRNRKEKRENIDKQRFDLDRYENIPERAKELLTAVELLVENKRDKDFFINLGKIKIYMAYPLIQNEILYELLTRMEGEQYKLCYMDTEKFIQTVSNMNDDQLREFIEKILDSLEFREENNTVVNMWLMENRKNVCNDLGIKF